jgi:hypothetical protein
VISWRIRQFWRYQDQTGKYLAKREISRSGIVAIGCFGRRCACFDMRAVKLGKLCVSGSFQVEGQRATCLKKGLNGGQGPQAGSLKKLGFAIGERKNVSAASPGSPHGGTLTD